MSTEWKWSKRANAGGTWWRSNGYKIADDGILGFKLTKRKRVLGDFRLLRDAQDFAEFWHSAGHSLEEFEASTSRRPA